MDFLTPEQVKIEAEKGEIPALEASLLHHQQGRDANYDELVSAMISGDFRPNTPDGCACCEKYGCCTTSCPLTITGQAEDCCEGHHDKVTDAWEEFTEDHSLDNFNKLTKAEAKLCTYISGVLERKRAEQRAKSGSCTGCKHDGGHNPCIPCDAYSNWEPKESKPALRHGEIRLWNIAIDPPNPYFVVDLSESDKINLLWLSDEKRTSHHTEDKILACSTYINNPLDDLALRAEDLIEFKYHNYTKTFNAKLEPDDTILMSLQGPWFGLKDLVEIHQKLGQMIATAKRKQKSK